MEVNGGKVCSEWPFIQKHIESTLKMSNTIFFIYFFLSQSSQDSVSTMCSGGLEDILVSCRAIRDGPYGTFDMVNISEVAEVFT